MVESDEDPFSINMSKIELLIATQNAHKLEEIKNIIGDRFHLISLAELDFHEDIPETADTLSGNASLKASFIHHKFKKNCLADDSGLEVFALNGAPGVYSARYAGEQKSYSDNNLHLLKNMRGIQNRSAQFRTIISLFWNGKEYPFEGIVKGQILEETRGNKGFGYDPLFVPEGFTQSFAEMDAAEKNKISHRAHALHALHDFLKSI